MLLKTCLALSLSMVCGVSAAQADDDFDKKALDDCRTTARELNKSSQVGIGLKNIEPLATWHAACAGAPPRGPGNVVSLCQGKRTADKDGKGVFFWKKSNKGKMQNGYIVCLL